MSHVIHLSWLYPCSTYFHYDCIPSDPVCRLLPQHSCNHYYRCYFSLASMFKASSYYVSGMDSAFSPISSDFPIGSFLLSVAARALFAFLIGVFWSVPGKADIRLSGSVLLPVFPPSCRPSWSLLLWVCCFPSSGMISEVP